MRKFIIASLAVMSFSAAALAAEQKYQVTIIDPPGGGESLNDNGTIVMNTVYGGGWRPRFWSNGVFSPVIDGLGGSIMSASQMNNLNQVVGYATVSNGGPSHAFLYSNGVTSDLGTLGGKTSRAVGINESGTVVGNSYLGNNEATTSQRGFIYTAGGGMQDLGTLGGRYTEVAGINDQGQVFGASETASGTRHLFMYQNGVMTDLTATAGLSSVAARLSVTTSGALLGFTPGGEYGAAFSYQNGKITYHGDSSYVPIDINLHGDILRADPMGGTSLERADGSMVYFEDAIAELVPDVDMLSGGRMNNKGQVLIGGTSFSSSTGYTFLLTPVPEPETWAMLLAGLGMLGWTARRKHLAAV